VVACAAGDPAPEARACLVIADIPTPRRAGARVALLQAAYQASILVISARFRRRRGASAAAAQHLGGQKVVPKP